MSDNEPNILPLASFVKCYGQYLPLRVRVEEGFHGNDEGSVISSGDIYNFHFIRNEKTMSVQDSCGTSFSVPFNSAISFGLIYNPFNEPIAAVRQYSFTSVGEIITCKCPPRIIRATKEFKSRDPKTSVYKDEILIVKRISQNRKKRKEYIRVHSLLTGEEKLLYRQCEGNFLTDPGSVRLYLPEIAEFFRESFPIVAKIFLNSDVTDDNVACLVSEVVTMTHVSIESSIIATTCTDVQSNQNELEVEEITESEQCIPIAIPVDLKIEVSVIKSQPGNNEDLYQMTRELFEGFHSSVIKDMNQSSTCTSHPVKILQRKLNGSIREGHERQGVVIEKPSKVYKKKSKTTHTAVDSKLKTLEFNQLGIQEDPDGYRERRTPSISYSTFISESTTNPTCKQTLEDKPTSCDKVLRGTCTNGSSQKQSHPSVLVMPTCTSEEFKLLTNADELLSIPQGKVVPEWEEDSSSADAHPPSDIESVALSNTHSSSNYDTPRKLMSQSIDTTRVWGSSTGLQSDSRDKIKSVALPPYQSPTTYTPNDMICLHATQNSENKSLPMYNLAASIGGETTYDTPCTLIKPMLPYPAERHPQISKCDLVGTVSKEYDPSTNSSLLLENSVFTNPCPDPSFMDMGTTCPSNTKQAPTFTCEKSIPLSEMIKNHPLLKCQHRVQKSSSCTKTQTQCSNSSSLCSHVSPSKNDPTSTKVTLLTSSFNSLRREMQSEVHDDTYQQGCLSTTLSKINPSSKHSSLNSNTTEYSRVVNASMNRAQTLIARNIQELKRLDCQKILTLLENMNLGQYKRCFLRERIDGEILAECDEKVLLHELDVHSEEHRRQIMNVITGKQSVTLILSGQGMYNYVRLMQSN